MEDIADLLGCTPAEVRGTASFYDMLHTEPVGRHVVTVCTNIACMLAGAYEVLDHAEASLGVSVGQTSADGEFTLEEAECLAGCDRAPCVQVNSRFFGPVDPDGFDALAEDLPGAPQRNRAGARDLESGGAQRGPARPRGEIAGRGRPPAGSHRLVGDGGAVITTPPRIVTSRVGLPDSFTLERYLATGGYEGLRKALSMAPADVAAEVNKASLLGRGGAGFPAGRKWSMLRKAETTYLVVNGDESEPATFKDHMLIEADPHQIIEGTTIAAYATGVEQAFIYCRGEFALGFERLQQACNEAYAYGALGAGVLGSGYALDIVIHPGAGAYICGEETALLESLEGKRGFPRIKPPYFPAAVGLYGEPTVVNNVEPYPACRGSSPTGATHSPLWARDPRPGHGCSPFPGASSTRGGSRSRCRRPRSATSSTTLLWAAV